MNEDATNAPLNRIIAPDMRFAGVIYDHARNAFIREVDGSALALRPQSEEVLRLLAANPGRILSKEEIFGAIWPNTAVTDDSLVQCIADIRRALGPEARTTLRTVPRKGYALEGAVTGGVASRRLGLIAAVGATLLIAAVGLAISLWRTAPSEVGPAAPTLGLAYEGQVSEGLARALRPILSRYRSVRLLSGAGGEYRLELRSAGSGLVVAELSEADGGVVLLSRTVQANADQIAPALAGDVASPLTGAISRRLYELSRAAPIDTLSRAECYAHGFRVQGGLLNDEVARRAVSCLERLIDEDTSDARALALLAGARAIQYWWGVGLDEPLRSDVALREPLQREAVALAGRAETEGRTDDSSIYYAMTRAYYAGCEREKAKQSALKGLEINPDDPTLLGGFGNWIAYAGDWDLGEGWARRAVALQPRDYQNWWWWSIAKAEWRRGDYEAALSSFRKSYNELNWLSHVQLAYTLPFLGRDAEAMDAVRRLRDLRPGFSREDVRDMYRRWCFDDAYIEKMDGALAAAGLD